MNPRLKKRTTTLTFRAGLCSLFFHFIFIALHAQQYTLKFDNLSVRNGLPNNSVTCILQDQKGFLWFGTHKGLSRFDGYNFLNFQYDSQLPGSIPGDLVSALAEDHLGNLWVGTSSNGLSIYHPDNKSFEYLQPGKSDSLLIPHFSIRVIFRDSHDNMWVGTEDGLSVITPDHTLFRKWQFESGNEKTIHGKIVYDITESEDGRIWIATEHRNLSVYNFETDDFSEVAYTDLPLADTDDNVLKNLHFHDANTLYIASNNGGLSRLNIQTLAHKTYLPSNQSFSLSSMQIRDMISVNHEIWLGTDGEGINRFDTKTERFYQSSKSRLDRNALSSNTIWSLFRDRQGIVWIGTYEGGINQYDPQQNVFNLIENKPCEDQSLPNQPVLSMIETDQVLWIGTDWGGLVRKDPSGHYSIYNSENGLSTDVVKSMSTDKNGNLLLGTYNYGLTVFDIKKYQFKHYKREQTNHTELPSNHIWSVFTDSRDITWIGTLGGGITTFDTDLGVFKKPLLTYDNGGQQHINQITEDSQSNLWFSTEGGLIFYHRRTNTWNNWLLSEQLKIENHQLNQVKALVEDNKRHLWMATAAGLVKYEPETETFTLFDQKHGLPELPLLNLTEDGYGNLIIVSKTHLTSFDLSKQACIGYLIKDNSFNAGAILKSSDGSIFIGGSNGITSFDPQQLWKNEFSPPVYLSNFQVISQSKTEPFALKSAVETLEQIEIGPDETVINFEFTALNYSESERNQFAYWLEGFDENWQEPTFRRFATYTNLDPGTYTFHVKASNNHGVWNEKGSSITLIVRPPFWKSTWFKVFSALIVLLAGYLIQRFRISQIRKDYEHQQLINEQELIRLKNEHLHQELESTKSEMNSVTMNFLHKNQKLQKIRQKVKETADKVSNEDAGRINKLVKDIDQELQNEDYWDEFEHQFNKSHDDFLERFKQAYPDLSKRELRICAHLRMGLDNNEIAALMNVTLRTVEQSRYRIRLKINLEKRQSFTKMILRF